MFVFYLSITKSKMATKAGQSFNIHYRTLWKN